MWVCCFSIIYEINTLFRLKTYLNGYIHFFLITIRKGNNYTNKQ